MHSYNKHTTFKKGNPASKIQVGKKEMGYY